MITNTFFPQGPFLDPLTQDISLEWKLFLMNLQFGVVNQPVSTDGLIATSTFLPHPGPATLFQSNSESILANQVFGA